ncbi:hypothetical protein C8R45DRAFT_1110079 [Mycena sanguinolenta]|nr:hypothetical protein C8R45DRAFT_1110079 [Mycena sanguinolenta]
MGKKPKTAARMRAIAAAKEFISSPAAVAIVESGHPASNTVATLVAEIATIHPELTSLDGIIGFAMDATKPGSAAGDGWRVLHGKVRAAKREAKAGSDSASHREKRRLVDALGLNCTPRSLAEFIADAPANRDLSSHLHPHIVFRKRSANPSKRGVSLADTKCRPDDDLIINEEAGYYIVLPGESIFIKSNSVYCGAFYLARFSNELYEHFRGVIATACSERRNVRPRHDGEMVQVGWNSGPFHARFFGFAVSFERDIDQSTATHHDIDAIAVGDIGLPKLATRNVAEGTGYRISIGSKEYDFPLHERAPCEGLFTQNYASPTHIDAAHAPYTFSWTVVREPDVSRPQQPESDRILRSGRSQPAEDPMKWPSYGGGNFVDSFFMERLVSVVLMQQG